MRNRLEPWNEARKQGRKPLLVMEEASGKEVSRRERQGYVAARVYTYSPFQDGASTTTTLPNKKGKKEEGTISAAEIQRQNNNKRMIYDGGIRRNDLLFHLCFSIWLLDGVRERREKNQKQKQKTSTPEMPTDGRNIVQWTESAEE